MKHMFALSVLLGIKQKRKGLPETVSRTLSVISITRLSRSRRCRARAAGISVFRPIIGVTDRNNRETSHDKKYEDVLAICDNIVPLDVARFAEHLALLDIRAETRVSF